MQNMANQNQPGAASTVQPSQLDKQATPESQFALGEKYEFGDGVAQDYAKAGTWYRRAARQGHAQAKEKLQLPWLNGELEPMKSTPSLFTLNGFGFKLYGKSDFDPATESFMTTHYLTFVFLPVLPLARYRVISPDGHSYRFLGKGPLRAIDKLHMALFAGAVLWFVISAKLRH